MNIEPSLVTNGQASEVVEPSEGSLHYPTVLAKLLAALNSASGDTRSDPSLSQRLPVSFRVVSFVSMHLLRSLTRSASFSFDGRNGINHRLQHLGIVNVGSGASYREGYSPSTDHKMALRAWFALIRRIRTDCFAPFLARILAESKHARSQPISPASFSLLSNTWCSFPQTPACCQSRRRRQQVMPLPQPISWGSISHCKPVRSTNKIPVSTARLEIRGRPPLGLGGSGGKSGSITSHNSSVSSGFAIPYFTVISRFC